MGGVVSGPVADADEFVMLLETTRRGRGRDRDLLLCMGCWWRRTRVRAERLRVLYRPCRTEKRRGRTRRCLS